MATATTTSLAVNISPALKYELQKIARQEGASLHEILGEALAEFVKNKRSQSPAITEQPQLTLARLHDFETNHCQTVPLDSAKARNKAKLLAKAQAMGIIHE